MSLRCLLILAAVLVAAAIAVSYLDAGAGARAGTQVSVITSAGNSDGGLR